MAWPVTELINHEATQAPRRGVYRALVPELLVVNAPALYEDCCEGVVPGIYIGARTGGKTAGTGVDGADISRTRTSEPIAVYVSRDKGANYSLLTTLSSHITTGTSIFTDKHFGITASAAEVGFNTTDGIALMGKVDRVGTLVVQWDDGYTPTSCTLDELLNGENKLMVGDELCSYEIAAATQIVDLGDGTPGNTDRTDAGVYFHHNMLRGLRGTETEINGDNRVFERVIALDSNSFKFVTLGYADIGKELYFKAGTPGMDLGDFEAKSIVFTARNLKPVNVANPIGVRDASNNLTITWDRRTRANVRLLGNSALPYGEDTDKYRVDFLSAGKPYTVLRTSDVTTTSATYTAAHQSADGLTPGAAINFRVRQWSNAVGYGFTNDWVIAANTGGTAVPTTAHKIPAGTT